MGPGKPFAIRWKPQVQELEAKLVSACDCNTVIVAAAGAIRLDSLFIFDVSQGRLEQLRFRVPAAYSASGLIRKSVTSCWPAGSI